MKRLLRRCRINLDCELCFFCGRRAAFESEDGVRFCNNCLKIAKKTKFDIDYTGARNKCLNLEQISR